MKVLRQLAVLIVAALIELMQDRPLRRSFPDNIHNFAEVTTQIELDQCPFDNPTVRLDFKHDYTLTSRHDFDHPRAVVLEPDTALLFVSSINTNLFSR